MTDPGMSAKRPAVVELQASTVYSWCACGRSKTQPYCDGSHAGTDFEPIDFTVERRKSHAICQCKRTCNPPFCDGTHSGS